MSDTPMLYTYSI